MPYSAGVGRFAASGLALTNLIDTQRTKLCGLQAKQDRLQKIATRETKVKTLRMAFGALATIGGFVLA